MNDNVAQRIFFGILLVAVSIAFVWLIRHFLQPIFWAVALAIVFYPVNRKLRELLGGRRSLAAALCVVTILLVVVLPITGIIGVMATEAAGLIQRITCDPAEAADPAVPTNPADPAEPECDKIDVNAALDWAKGAVPLVMDTAGRLGIGEDDVDRLQSQLSNSAVAVSQFLAARAVSLGQDTIRVAIYFFLMLYLLFYFLRDARTILDALVRALPFGDERERHLLSRFAEVSRATIKGSLVVGIVQGFIGGVLFAAVGIRAPVLWGVVMAMASMVPPIGPSLVWLPTAIVLIVQGHIWSGIIVIAVGALVIGLVDNLLRPILVGRDTRLPDYLILLSTLGGLLGFGLAGIVIGPIIAAFFLSVWEMAEQEYADRDRPGT
jgi:predicted PurR-regulated permease PerM